MQTIDQKIKGLQDEINLWTSLLQPHMDRLRQMDMAEYKIYMLGQGSREDDVSAEFAIESLIGAYGRLHDVVLAAKSFWPQRMDNYDFEKSLSESDTEKIIQMLRDRSDNVDAYPWAENLILKRTESLDKESFEDHEHAPDLEELFIMAHRWRRVLAKSAALHFLFLALKERLGVKSQWIEHIQDAVKKLNPSDRIIFRDSLRRYLASEFIFPWLSEQYNPAVLRYDSLFMLAELEEKSMKDYDYKLWDKFFQSLDINDNTRGMLSSIIERISNALQQIGNYNELVDQIVWGDGSSGPNSLVGSLGRVNIIPSDDKDGECCEILLAFARGRKGKNGLSTIMRQVREHMIRCSESACRRGQPTQFAIIFTDLWDKEIFSESIGDIKAHLYSNPRKIIFGALVNKDQITPQAII